MYTKWTSHLTTEKDKDNFRNQIRASKDVLERMKQLLNEEEDVLNKSEINQKSYETNSWSSLQAHKNGYRQCIHIIKTLVDLDQQEHEEHDRITLNRRGK